MAFRLAVVIILAVQYIFILHSASAAVLPGIDVLNIRKFDILQGKRVGLITNQTGRTASGVSTIDILSRAPGLRLVALFSPEHGIRGVADEKLDSSIDRKTGLPINSLYGATCRPTPEMLKGVDVLVFDIQGIGTRFYTYVGTLSLAMRAAKDAGIPFVVLDRPNPIGGQRVEGAVPVVQPGDGRNSCGALTSIHPIPTRHGMTAGELARFFNTEFGINCDLAVVPMLGWLRTMYYDETGLEWINPSPNMKSLDSAILYPGLGVLETTNLSVGRGTDKPFQKFGAPWVNGSLVARNLAARNIPGITFAPCEFVPTASGHPYQGKKCFGVCVASIDRVRIDPVMTGLYLLKVFAETYPLQFKVYGGFKTEVGDSKAWELLKSENVGPEEVARAWEVGQERFRKLRKRYLLY